MQMQPCDKSEPARDRDMMDRRSSVSSVTQSIQGQVEYADADAAQHFPAWYWQRLLCDGDTHLQVLRKKVMTAIYATIVALIGSIILWNLYGTQTTPWSTRVANIVFLVAVGILWVSMYITKEASSRHITAAAIAVTAFVITIDLGDATTRELRRWPLVILVIDGLLVLRVGTVDRIIVAAVLTWLALETAESWSRFGLFDFSFSLSQEQRHETMCACDKLPCPLREKAVTAFATGAFILVVDYILTRSFAERLHKEQAIVENTCMIAQQITQHLVAFDLETANTVLNSPSGRTIPKELSQALGNLLANLNAYRPYLPQALLGGQSSRRQRSARSTVTRVWDAGTDVAALMFTDIRNSTRVWQMCPESMKRALPLHNSLIRAVLVTFEGYEVKTIGDSFMIAFENPTMALRCGLAIQVGLLGVDWPSSLLTLPQCACDDDGLWGGLAVRIGVSFGAVEKELNEITGRYDFFGDIVNRASRMESVCVPGGVAAMSDLMERVLPLMGADECVVMSTFTRDLKGYGLNNSITVIVPHALRGRINNTHDDLTALKTRELEQEVNPDSPVMSVITDKEWHDVGSGVLEPSPLFGRRIMGEELRDFYATTAVLQFTLPECVDADALSLYVRPLFSNVMNMAERTSATILTTVHNYIVLRWDPHHGCVSDADESALFVSLMLQSSGDSNDSRSGLKLFHIGLARAAGYSGSVGNDNERFITHISPSVGVSFELAAMAARRSPSCSSALCAVPSHTAAKDKVSHSVRIHLDYAQDIEARWSEGLSTLHVYRMVLPDVSPRG